MRYVRAAGVDKSLAKARDDGLAKIRRTEATEGVRDLEMRVRSGKDARGASLLAAAILDSVYAAELTDAERRRVAALGDLARKLVKRETERQLMAEAKAKAAALKATLPKTPVEMPVAPGMPDDLPEIDDELAPIRAKLAKAEHAREVAADPEVPLAKATRHLEIAARELLDGRRLARKIRPQDLDELGAQELEDLGLDLRALLVSTYLELADLYRQQQLFDEARARVRAVLILDPGNEDAWAQRRLIEDDLRAFYEPTLEPVDPYRYTIRSVFSHGWWSPSPWYGWCNPCARPVPYIRTGVRFGYGHRPAYRGGGGVRRATGVRR